MTRRHSGQVGMAKELAYYHTYVGHTNEALVKLSDRIIKMAPQGMSKVYYGMSGSDANETQLKLVWYYNNVRGLPEKKKIISRDRAYHGSSIASGSIYRMLVGSVPVDDRRKPKYLNVSTETRASP